MSLILHPLERQGHLADLSSDQLGKERLAVFVLPTDCYSQVKGAVGGC